MELFGMGFWEIFLVLVIALIIWGPGRLPEIARTIGKTIRALRKASSDFTGAITREIETEEKLKPPASTQPKDDGKQND
ncbi:MAG: Sec-independent protein translocase protein TatB [Dehalococcoidales bacterium]|nr:Sec-independent protein translocase protein TatB [Dehalococcoidales bacterium]